MRCGQKAGFRDRDGRHFQASRTSGDSASQRPEGRFGGSFMKHMQFVDARGRVDREPAVLSGLGEIGRVQYYNNRAHVRMNIAEYSHYAGTREADGARSARRIQPDVERLPVIARKCIVKNRIEIWKIDLCARLDGQHVRTEGLVLLNHPAVFRWFERNSVRHWNQ